MFVKKQQPCFSWNAPRTIAARSSLCERRHARHADERCGLPRNVRNASHVLFTSLRSMGLQGHFRVTQGEKDIIVNQRRIYLRGSRTGRQQSTEYSLNTV